MITMTPAAAEKVKELLTQRGTPESGLRIGVRGGGCSGNSYFMVLLGGTEIDYVEGLMGAGFKFNNPNVKHNCACGESFSA